MRPGVQTARSQAGFSYVEMLVASVIVLVSMSAATEALQSARLAAEIQQSETQRHYRLLGRLEDVLAEPFDQLLNAGAQAGSRSVPTSYSDPVGTPDRMVVYVSLYDIADTDGDKKVFTIDDPDTDGDKDPYTGVDVEIDLAWVRVEIPGTRYGLETLSRR